MLSISSLLKVTFAPVQLLGQGAVRVGFCAARIASLLAGTVTVKLSLLTAETSTPALKPSASAGRLNDSARMRTRSMEVSFFISCSPPTQSVSVITIKLQVSWRTLPAPFPSSFTTRSSLPLS